MSSTATIQTPAGTIEIDCPANVGPLGAFRSAGAAARCLARYADLLEDDDVTDGTVFRALDNRSDDRRVWHVAALSYNRPVRR